jgi:hypothetical protein
VNGFECKILIGGASLPENMVLNDMWFLDLSAIDWNQQNNLAGAKWV